MIYRPSPSAPAAAAVEPIERPPEAIVIVVEKYLGIKEKQILIQKKL